MDRKEEKDGEKERERCESKIELTAMRGAAVGGDEKWLIGVQRVARVPRVQMPTWLVNKTQLVVG